jgi:hypothetical protein
VQDYAAPDVLLYTPDRAAEPQPPVNRVLMTRENASFLACGALAGLVVALVVLPPGFIGGSGGLWPRPRHDLNAYLITWEYFVRDAWRFPPLDVPQMGYPEGGSVLLTDGLPIAQLVSKAIYSLTGAAINPFGWWILLTYILQGAMAARIAYAAGARTHVATIGAAVIAVCTTFFMGRIWHVAISSHFLILWALALYLENVRERRFTAGEHLALSCVTLWVNAYLFVMVGLLQSVTFLTLLARRALARRDWIRAGVLLAATVAVGLMSGYGTLFGGPATLRAEGFGVFSWNPISLVVPPPSHWGPHGIVREAIPGQAEGDSYPGAGVLLVLLACLLGRSRHVLRAIRGHWVLVIGLLFCAALAASNRVFLGPIEVVNVALPESIMNVASLFRASGRFIWVPVYVVALFGFAILVTRTPPRFAIAMVIVAAALQVWEIQPTMRALRVVLATPDIERIDEARVRSWMEGHDRLLQFTSWSCGGLWSGKPEERVENALRELQINLAAARVGLSTNTVYTSRQVKNCAAEARWAEHPRLKNRVLHLVNKTVGDRTPALSALVRSPACVDSGWAFVCSLKKLDASGLAQDSAR